MNHDWRGPLFRRAVLALAACLLIGLISGEYAWPIVATLSAVLLWHLRQLQRLHHWLRHRQTDEAPPESNSLWGEIFDSIYHLQRRDQKARERLQTVIDRVQESTTALKDAVILLEQDGTLQWWNPAAEQLLGLKKPDDISQPITNLVRDPRFIEYYDAQAYSELLELPSPINPRVRLQFQVTQYGNGEHLMLVRDVTRLFQLEQMRKDFVANVSHELRTPLTVVSGYLETLLDNTKSIEPRWLRALQQMQVQSARMQNLLNDLLLLAKLETTDYPSDNQPIDVSELLQNIQRDAQTLSAEQQHHIALETDPRLHLKGSEMELHSAFSNLVFNAVKYTPAKGVIKLRWWADDQGAHLSVTDSGIGIEDIHLSRITERFYRVDASRASNTGGTGLGLAIVKHVLLRHRGHLEITSQVGLGSTFSCHFPKSHLLHMAE